MKKILMAVFSVLFCTTSIAAVEMAAEPLYGAKVTDKKGTTRMPCDVGKVYIVEGGNSFGAFEYSAAVCRSAIAGVNDSPLKADWIIFQYQSSDTENKDRNRKFAGEQCLLSPDGWNCKKWFPIWNADLEVNEEFRVLYDDADAFTKAKMK